MMEEKDKEISRLMDDNKDLHQSLESRPPVGSFFLDNSILIQFSDIVCSHMCYPLF